MTARCWKAVMALGLLLLPLSSCTAKYQDMLRDREETIRDLEDKLSTTRGENDRLRRDLAQAQTDLGSAREATGKKAAVPSEANDLEERLKRQMLNEGLKPDEAQVRRRHGRLSIGVPSSVTFASGSTKVSPEGQTVLTRVAKAIQTLASDKKIYVEGHTDTDPINKTKDRFRSNRHLSTERADAVAAFFTEKCGIREDRLVIMGFGQYDPVSPRDKAANRRVEIVIAD